MLSTWGASKSLAARVRDIFAKFGTNAHMYLAGTEITQGFTPGNYVESTGVTPATVDQPVGLVLDGAGSVGAELAPALEAANWGVVNADATHIVTFSGGTVRYQSDTTTPSLTLQKTGLLTIGKTYKVEITVSSYTSGSLKSDVSTGIIVGAVGKFTFNVQSATTAFNLYRNTTNVDLTISSISIREITGIHASQSTSGYRPTLRSSSGKYYWQFDGTDDRLSLGSVPFQMSDDFCLTVAFRCEDISVTRHMVCATGGGGTQRISLYITPTTGQITAFFRDDAGNNTVKQAPGNYLNVTAVAQIVKRSGNVSIWVNGILSGTESAINPSIGVTTLTEFAISGSPIVGNYFKGTIHCAIPVKGTFTDADILLMAKSAAQIAGVTLS